jgi:hypothetical protein
VGHHHQSRPGVLAYSLDAGQHRPHGIQVGARGCAGHGQIQRIQHHQGRRVLGQLGRDRLELFAAGQLRHPEAQPQPPPRRQLIEVEVLVGADSLQPTHHGALPTLAQKHQHRPGGWAGELA